MEVGDPVDPQLEDAFDWLAIERELRSGAEDRTWGNTAPSGLFALEIDSDTREVAGLSDAQLVDAMVGFERLAAWAQARQARVLAEFARRRPGDDSTMVATDKPCAMSRFAPDEVGLALKLARLTAKTRIGRSVQLEQVLPETLAVWQRGRLDERRVAAVCEATHYLSVEKARAVQHRILDRAPDQTVGQLKAALKRAVIAVDPEGAAERHQAARRDRRVSITEEPDGMASLWALMTAPDAQASYQWLTRLALGCGKEDPRSMDARRADLAAALLSGRLTNAAPDTPIATPSSGTDSADDTDGGTDDRGADDRGAGDQGAGAAASTHDGAPAGAAGSKAAAHATDSANDSADGGAAPDRADGGSGSPTSGNASPPRPVNPGKPLVQVLIPFTTLLGADNHPCELVGHGPITADHARHIATDATLKRLVYDPLSGTILDHGRTTYRPPAALADFVRARDVYCRSPICRRRALDGHLDHITPYPHGPTNEPNIHGCCGHEHRMKHAPGWAVRALPDGRIQWITPTGHRYHSEPYDYRTDDDLPLDKAAARKGLPKDLAARLERIERNRRATARWDGQPVPEEDDDGPPPF
ncbi:HNH endonuclease [Pseudonocardia sp. DSM 110487]|uniref:HNH endonuclease signature motif containing protein n=1 Tax=Pseudonocardia sp. DSM 110487 TaxID=2865833 RepID=UPI001C69AD0A|nr:HNH endonuclease signature motif containing protein [Pseudonocardia sp. DSM 110487]QYN39264.1 HNH endonuclease [Pseudonocardia sp. DSM 110487]